MSPWLFPRTSFAWLARKVLLSIQPRQALQLPTSLTLYSYPCSLRVPVACRLTTSTTQNVVHTSDRSSKTSLVDFLARLLSSPDLSDVSTFKALYLSSRRIDLHAQLSSERLSTIISLYGTLSLPAQQVLKVQPDDADEVNSTFSLSPIARKLLGGGDATITPSDSHWSFVVTVAKDKRALGYRLSDGDNYWLMHAALQDVRRKIGLHSNDNKALRDHLDRARTYYFNIHSHHPWRTHHAYLDALLSFADELPQSMTNKLSNEVIERLATILSWRLALHPKLLDLIWRAFLRPLDSTSVGAKEKLVEVLRRKFEKESTRLRHSPPDYEPDFDVVSGLSSPNRSNLVESAGPYSIQGVQQRFVHLLFSPLLTDNSEAFADARHWILWQAQLSLGPTSTVDEEKRRLSIVWNNLRLLALSLRTGKSNKENADNSDAGLMTATTPGWTVICSLSAVERVIKNDDLGDDRQRIRQLVQSLWILWRRETEYALSFSLMNAFAKPDPTSEPYISGGSHLPRAEVPTSVLCAVAASFLRLAAQIEDVRLSRAVLRHIERVIVEPALLAGHVVSNGALRAIAVQTCVAGTVLGGNYSQAMENQTGQWSWNSVLEHMHAERLLPEIRHREDSGTWTNAVANDVLRELVNYSVEGAYSLYMSSRDFGLQLSEDTIMVLGRAFIAAGNRDLALVCVRDTRLSSAPTQLLFDTTLRSMIRSRGFLGIHLVRSLIGIMKSIKLDGALLMPTKGRDMEKLIAMCMRAGHVEEAGQIVLLVQRSNPGGDKPATLHSKFIKRFIRTLLSSRRYRLLTQMLLDSSSSRIPSEPSYDISTNANDVQSQILQHPQFRFVRRILMATSQDSSGPLTSKINSRLVRRSIPFSRYDWPTLSRFVRFRPHLALEDKRIISLQLSDALRKLRQTDTGKPTEIDERTLENIASILVRIGRVSAALKILDVYSKKTKDGKPSISTRAGNIILGASLLPRRNRRNLRQFRHTARRLQELVNERGFVPDRITLNILMKALLRWEHLTPSDTLRELFDKLVESGYPYTGSPSYTGFFDSASKPKSETQGALNPDLPNNLMIRTSVTNKKDKARTKHRLNFNMSAFSSYSKRLSFEMHVRPLYKMFIKAFYARGDKEAARSVVESLRVLQSEAVKERARRSYVKYRRRGKAREGKQSTAGQQSN